MANAPDFYIDHIRKHFSPYHATWLPDAELSVGDIIKLEDGKIETYSHLSSRDIDIPFEITVSETPSDITCNTDSGIDMNPLNANGALAAGAIVKEVKLGFDIHFKTDKNIVFELSGCRTYKIKDIAPVEAAVRKKYKEKSWRKEWLIVTEIKKADAGVILISLSGNTSISLTAEATVAAGALKISNPSLKADNSTKSSGVMHFSKSGITPLFACQGISSSFFQTNFGSRNIGVAEEAMNDITLVEVDPYQPEENGILEIDPSDL